MTLEGRKRAWRCTVATQPAPWGDPLMESDSWDSAVVERVTASARAVCVAVADTLAPSARRTDSGGVCLLHPPELDAAAAGLEKDRGRRLADLPISSRSSLLADGRSQRRKSPAPPKRQPHRAAPRAVIRRLAARGHHSRRETLWRSSQSEVQLCCESRGNTPGRRSKRAVRR